MFVDKKCSLNYFLQCFYLKKIRMTFSTETNGSVNVSHLPVNRKPEIPSNSGP